jgi:hypothetical protein
MKVYLLIDETGEGDYPIGIYSSSDAALKAIATLRNTFYTSLREYTMDDPVTHNYLRIKWFKERV